MKLFSKINRGLILSIVVLIIIIVNVMTLSFSHRMDTPKIKDICSKYIKTAVHYRLLPEKYFKVNQEMPQDELNKYIADMTSDIKAFYSNNEQTYKYLIERNKIDLKNQSKGIGVVNSYIKDIAEYKKFNFDGNTVIVNIVTNSVYDGPFYDGQMVNVSSQTTDTISLQKIDGKWKVIYADLQLPVNNQNNNSAIIK